MRTAATTAMAIAAFVAAVAASPSAEAASYRYWTYWQAANTGWTFATAGPATTVPADGAVEGWRFAVTSASGRASDAPRTAPDFAALCAGTPQEPGRKRVGLVLDFGTGDAAPSGETPPPTLTTCVVADADATGYELLRSVAQVRTDDVGLVCALADYPRTGCAELVDQMPSSAASMTASTTVDADIAATETSTSPQESGSSPVTTALVLAVIAILAGAAVLVARRRRA